MSVIIKLLSKFDDSGLRKAKSGFGGLKSTLGAIGIGVGLKQIADGLLDAAKAASIDQKSQQLLNNQLTRNAGATKEQVKQNNKFIDTLAMQVGIADDELRPAQARLARATGSTAKSQTLLKLALDASTVSGKPLESVSTALAKAFNGNTTSLKKMFPELSKSKDIIGDLTKTVQGAAAEQADPFAKMNVAFGELQEKLGSIILPYLEDFIDDMMKPGGAIDQVAMFLDDVSNPKTEAGQTFIQIKDAVESTIQGVKDFFAIFGDGDATKGFGNVASALVKALPALLALKGILMLAGAGKSIANLAKAVGLIKGAGAVSSIGAAGAGIASVALMSIAAIALTQFAAAIATGMSDASIKQKLKEKGLQATVTTSVFSGSNGQTMSIPNTGNVNDLFGFYKEAGLKPPTGNTVINVNVTKADPKAVYDAFVKYGKDNGIPLSTFTRPRG